MANFIDRKSINNNWQGGQKDDYFDGGGGNDTIRGGAGNDRIYGGSGDDQLHGEDGNDDIYGGAGNDQLDGGSGGDDIWGETGNDTLIGGSGNDALRGGLGADLMTGGADGDEFTYTSLSDSTPGNADTITDFSASAGDWLLFVNLDANASHAGWQVWEYATGGVPSANFPTSGNGQATIVFDGQFTVITLYNNEVNADGTANLDADFQLKLLGDYDPNTLQISVLDTANVALHDGLLFFG